MIDHDPVERQLALAWQAFTPPSQLRERVRARLGASGQVPLPVVAGTALVPNRWRSLRQSGNVGLAVGVGLFGLGCVAGLLGSVFVTERLSQSSSAETGVQSEAGELTAPSVWAIPSVPERLEAAQALAPETLAAPPALPTAPIRESATGRGASRGAEVVRGPPLQATTPRDWRGELALLERAERAVRADNAALALALLGEFDVQYPKSLLIEERAAVETMAYCQADTTDATARAARFLSAYPNSVYRARVGVACQLEARTSTERPL